MPQCPKCQSAFENRDTDRVFYGKMNVPDPKFCPDCRQQRRLMWRNERSLYRRKCDLTGKSVISFYPEDSPYTVYAQDEWWTDKWDGLKFGRDFDFDRPFFEQFQELLKAVPHMAMVISHGENSDYCPYSTDYKNSYSCVSGRKGEDIYYSFMMNDSRDCMDCYVCPKSELCYECINCVNLYNSIFSKYCKNSSDLAFCLNCESSSDCIGSYGLRNKKYYVFNEQVGEEEYKKIYKELISSVANLESARQKSREHFLKYSQRGIQMINCENCSGDQLLNCKNSHDCYMSEDLEDCAYVWNTPRAKDCQDMNYSSHAELIYNSMSNVNSYSSVCNVSSWDVKSTCYSFQCFYGNDLFGCVGLKQKKNCILNKQYSIEEYKNLKNQIIEHMKKTGEWGEFFPITLSPFAYNETIAQDFFPLTKEEVTSKGWQWNDKTEKLPDVEKTIPANRLPDKIEDVPNDILNWAIICEKSKKSFKVIPQELKFYRKIGLPIPHNSPAQRYLDRNSQINPYKLWDRNCAKCNAVIQTSYAPDRPEQVYCEECYLSAIY